MAIQYKMMTCPSESLLNEIGYFRINAYKAGGMAPPSDRLDEQGRWLDKWDFDPKTIYWLAYDKQNLIATARLTMHEELSAAPLYDDFQGKVDNLDIPIAVPGRLIVHPDYRGQGIGTTLCRLRIQKAYALGGQTFLVSAIGVGNANLWIALGFDMIGTVENPRWNTKGKKFHLMMATRAQLESKDLQESPVSVESTLTP